MSDAPILGEPFEPGEGHRPCVSLGATVALIADLHGAERTLRRALDLSRDHGVETVALLGDLFDRLEQAGPIARVLEGWRIVGVYGNHEADLAQELEDGTLSQALAPDVASLLAVLRNRIVLDDVCLVHDDPDWGRHDPMAALFGRDRGGMTARRMEEPWITFSGHTHVRAARDLRGPLDIVRGRLRLEHDRRYLINPGALMMGQFAIWDRANDEIVFRQLV